MDDLISRKVAIDEFNGVEVNDDEIRTEYDVGFNDGIDLAIRKLSDLPSVEPKKENEKCSNKLSCGWCSLFDAPCLVGGE